MVDTGSTSTGQTLSGTLNITAYQGIFHDEQEIQDIVVLEVIIAFIVIFIIAISKILLSNTFR